MAALERFRRKPLLVIDADPARIFGQVAASLTMRGRSADFRVQDLWLASQAIQHNFKFLALNKKDFEDIHGIDLIIMPKTQ